MVERMTWLISDLGQKPAGTLPLFFRQSAPKFRSVWWRLNEPLLRCAAKHRRPAACPPDTGNACLAAFIDRMVPWILSPSLTGLSPCGARS